MIGRKERKGAEKIKRVGDPICFTEENEGNEEISKGDN